MSSKEHPKYRNVTIEDIDTALYDWFDKDVNSSVKTPNEHLKKVPIVFSSGERWSTSRETRGIRDKNGLLILPVISIHRTGINRDRNAPIALGTEQKTLTVAKRIDPKTYTIQNAIDNRSIAARRKKDKAVYEVTTIPFPDWFVTSYHVEIQAQYIQQMNSILEKVFSTLDIQNSFVMPIRNSNFRSDPKTKEWDEREKLPDHYFVGFIDNDLSDDGNFEEFSDSERIIKYNFPITVPSYLQLDPEGKRPAIQKKYTTYDINFLDECVTFVDDPEDLEKIFGPSGD